MKTFVTELPSRDIATVGDAAMKETIGEGNRQDRFGSGCGPGVRKHLAELFMLMSIGTEVPVFSDVNTSFWSSQSEMCPRDAWGAIRFLIRDADPDASLLCGITI